MKKYILKRWYPSLPKEWKTTDRYELREEWMFNLSRDETELLHSEELHPDFWEEVKQPLFVTEDGFKFFSETSREFYIVVNFIKYRSTISDFEDQKKLSHKVFYHESNADEYIRLNKKDYSLNDIERNIESLAKNLGYRLIKVQNDSQWTPAPEDCTCWKIKEKAESSSKCEAEKIDGACPKCGGELEYSHFDRVLLSNPPKRQINCTECAYVGYLTEERSSKWK